VSFPDPHHPFDAPEPWASLHRPEEVDIPEHRTRDVDIRPWWHKAALETDIPGEHKSLREKYSRMPQVSEAHLREITANYYGQLSLIDHNVGRILAALDEQGLSDNTYIVYSSDHGDWLGDHGLGADSLMPNHSRSMRDVISGAGKRDFALNEWELLPGRVGVGLSLRTVRSKTAKLTIEMQSGAGEMYDLDKDPDEMVNVFEDPAYAKLREELTAMLRTRPDDVKPNGVQVGMA